MLAPEYGTFWINRLQYAAADASIQDLGTFEQKITTGDYQFDSDQTQSTYILSDLTGGGQVKNANEGSDQGRYWWGDLMTAWPQQVTLGRETVAYPRPAGVNPFDIAIPLGDVGGSFYVTFSRALHVWSEVTKAFVDTTQILNATPVNRATVHGIDDVVYLFIPLGADGYDVWDGTDLAHFTEPMLDFVEWDDKLIGITPDGNIKASTDGFTWEQRAHLNARYRPRLVDTFFDRNGEPTIYIVTDRSLMSFDYETNYIYPTELKFPPHPDNGRAAAYWRDSYFTACGSEIYQYTGGAISGRGPTREDGLPQEYRGSITAMTDEHNGLYALVSGRRTANEDDPEFVGSMGPHQWDAQFNSSAANSSLLWYTGNGWHAAWLGSANLGTPSLVLVSEQPAGATGESYRLWWGVGNKMYTQLLPRDYHNPRQGLKSGVDRFASSGFLISSWFDANMNGFRKIMSAVQIGLDDAAPGVDVTLEYQLESEDSPWVPLGTADTVGATIFVPGEPLDPLPQTRPGVGEQGGNAGVVFSRMRLRATARTNDVTASPVITYILIKFIKIPLSVSTWSVNIDLTTDKPWLGRSNNQMREELKRFLTWDSMLAISIGRLADDPAGQANVYRARMSQLIGSDNLMETSGNRKVTFIEVPATTPIWSAITT